MAVMRAFHSVKSGCVVIDSGDEKGRRRFGLQRWSGQQSVGMQTYCIYAEGDRTTY